MIVLGGYFVPLGEHVLAPARAVLNERLAAQTRLPPSGRLSTLGIHAAAIGAAEPSLQSVGVWKPSLSRSRSSAKATSSAIEPSEADWLDSPPA